MWQSEGLMVHIAARDNEKIGVAHDIFYKLHPSRIVRSYNESSSDSLDSNAERKCHGSVESSSIKALHIYIQPDFECSSIDSVDIYLRKGRRTRPNWIVRLRVLSPFRVADGQQPKRTKVYIDVCASLSVRAHEHHSPPRGYCMGFYEVSRTERILVSSLKFFFRRSLFCIFLEFLAGVYSIYVYDAVM